jgi:hypothetical protein
MNNKLENVILKYLEIAYGDCKLFENEISFSISGICVYWKNTKRVGWVGEAHLDLVRYFGEGRYYTILSKWFSEKYKLEVM